MGDIYQGANLNHAHRLQLSGCAARRTTRPHGSAYIETTQFEASENAKTRGSFLPAFPFPIQVPNFVTLGEVQGFEMEDPKVGGLLP